MAAERTTMRVVQEMLQTNTAYDNIPDIGDYIRIIECGTSVYQHVGMKGRVISVNEENHEFVVLLPTGQECLAIVVEEAGLN